MSFSAGESARSRNPVPDFSRKIPTPFHLFHEAAALEDAFELEKGLKSGLSGAELYYSVKTNPLLPLLRALGARGWGLEVVGAENLRSALEAGVPAERFLVNGGAWNRAELEHLLFTVGASQVTVDSPSMAELLGAVLRERPTRLRIALRVHDGNSHFGHPLHRDAFAASLRAIPAGSIESLGLHLHVNPPGSLASIAETREDFRARARRLKEAMGLLGRGPDFLDVGGGIDSPYVFRPHPAELGEFHNPSLSPRFRARAGEVRWSLREAGAEIARALAEELGAEWKKRRVLFEPGRAVCQRALSTVISVRAVKHGFYPDAQVVVTDGNTAFLGPLHRGVYPLEAGREGSLPTFVYGGLPHSNDWLFQNVALPELREGDRLRILHTGAYFLPLEASFGHGLPAIVDAATGAILRP